MKPGGGTAGFLRGFQENPDLTRPAKIARLLESARLLFAGDGR
jgi:hypothetical protein